MRKTFLTLLGFIIIVFVVFLLLSNSGFLGGDIGKTGTDISGNIKDFVDQRVALAKGEGTVKKPKQPKQQKQTKQEDQSNQQEQNAAPQANKAPHFFEQLKTATPEELAEMILKGFKPTKPNADGEPPIVYMARYNDNYETYEIMLNIGATITQTNSKGQNALEVAIERGAPLEIIRLLYAQQKAYDEQLIREKAKQGPGPQVISSYFPALVNGR